MKKKLALILGLTGVMALALGACDTGKTGNSGNSGNSGSPDKEFATPSGEHKPVETTTYTGLSSAESVYAMGAVTTVSLLSAQSGMGVAALSTRSQTAAADDSAEFQKYLELIDEFLEKESLKTTVEPNPDAQYADYEIKMTVTASDLEGVNTHVLYYTETFTRTETEQEDGETETKTQYAVTGVMISGGIEYTVRGERVEETEQEDGESETKNAFEIRAYPDAADKKTYVKMSCETEWEEEGKKTEEERSYVYSVVENGKAVRKTSIETETEQKNGKEERSYEISFYDAQEGMRSKYELSREPWENGSMRYKVEYFLHNQTDGADRGVYTIVKDANGEYVYTFSDGTQKRYPGSQVDKKGDI